MRMVIEQLAIRCNTCARHVPVYHVEINGEAAGAGVYDALHCRDCIEARAVRGMRGINGIS